MCKHNLCNVSNGRSRVVTVLFRIFCIVWLGFVVVTASAGGIPGALKDAAAKVEAGEDVARVKGVLRRYAYSDDPPRRVMARASLAKAERLEGRPESALTWVEEYGKPLAGHFEWPVVDAYIEAARARFLLGQTFDAVGMLNTAKEKTEGLARVAVLRALSDVVLEQPDLLKALGFQKSALHYGNTYYTREWISETAGREPAKPGTETWEKWKLEILARIGELERRLSVQRYGLDYVLYREGQKFRNATHPLALDFTNVRAAFELKSELKAVAIPDTDFERAREAYGELVELFPESMYAQAAGVYLPVCLAREGKTEEAIRGLKAFYRNDPDGPYRGEALKLLGDLYLFRQWDERNAREAYERTVRWCEAMEQRTRILETYVIPEKSREASRPPRKIKILEEGGRLVEIDVPSDALVNRGTAEWYLKDLRVRAEWNLGFLYLIDDDWEKAFVHFDRALSNDEVLKEAHQKKVFNAYDRLEMGRKNGAILGQREQMRGLRGTEKTVMQWADFQFMLREFDCALDLYERIESAALQRKDRVIYARALLGEMLVRRQIKKLNPKRDVARMHAFVMENPDSPSAPFLLELCALTTPGEPLASQAYFKWIYTQYPTSYYAPRARYNEILRCVPWKDHDLRVAKINAFERDYPDQKNFIKALHEVDEIIRKKINEQEMRESSNETSG